MSGSEPPLADIVSFAERARARRRGSPSPSPDRATGAGEPADVAREAMFRRFAQLARSAGTGLGSVDDDLAVLVYDSASEPTATASVRGEETIASPRQLTFEAESFTLEVQLEGPSRELMCQVVPPQPASLEIRHRSGCRPLGRDEFGTFFAGALPDGPLSLRCVPLGDSPPATTSWFSLSVPARG